MAAPAIAGSARRHGRAVFSGPAATAARAAIARYYGLGIWGRAPVLPGDGYERLIAGLISGGFVPGTPFETAVDNSLAEGVVAEDPPPLP